MKKVIIIGKGDGWEMAPLEGVTWGVNDLCLRRPVKVVFNMHDLIKFGGSHLNSSVSEYCTLNNIPMVTLQHYDFITTSITYPLDKMHTDYFTNSISFMIAYALHGGATHIDMYGCNMATDGEYAYQKPNVEYWIGYARGSGVTVNVFGSTTLLKSKDDIIYGYNIKQTREVGNG